MGLSRFMRHKLSDHKEEEMVKADMEMVKMVAVTLPTFISISRVAWVMDMV